MIWLTWRQHRGEFFVVGGALALLLVTLLVTGNMIAATYQQLGIAACLTNSTDPNCSTIINQFREQFGFLRSAILWLDLAPVLLAMLIGAPLVAREVEQGTHRFIWTQGVTRQRWLSVKLIGILFAGVLISVVLTAVLSWWLEPFDQMSGHFTPSAFDFEGVVPIAYMLYAFALAIAAGALLRRTIPAMAATLAGFLAVRLPLEHYLRPYYQTPITVTMDPMQQNPSWSQQDWSIDAGFSDAGGHHLNFNQVLDTCAPRQTVAAVTKQSIFQCAHDHGWHTYAIYQPAARFWTFQGIEAAIYIVAALALLALTIWWVRRRIS